MRNQICVISLILILNSPQMLADTLTMPPLQREDPGVPMPKRGMNKEQVENQFGMPKQKVAVIGDPPISRWVYEKYTVVFEHQYVIHSLVPRKK